MEELKACLSQISDWFSSICNCSETKTTETQPPTDLNPPFNDEQTQTPAIPNPPSDLKSLADDQNQHQIPTISNTLTLNEKPLEESQNVEAERGNEGQEAEEEGECPFCTFMKGGGCKDCFVAWEKCMEDAETNKEDVVEKCYKITSDLKKCMDVHSDYYQPILQAEKAAEKEALKQLEKEKQKEGAVESEQGSELK